MYSYEYKPRALKDFKKLPRDIQKKIIKKLDYYVASGKPFSFAEHLTDYLLGEYRFRIGDYRVIFDAEGDRLIILTLGHRKDVYR